MPPPQLYPHIPRKGHAGKGIQKNSSPSHGLPPHLWKGGFRMKTKKRRMEFISFYNHTGLEKHFAKMAKKGWLIESMTNYYWTYRKIEPKDIHFCVTYYPRASDFDAVPSQKQQIFHEFCLQQHLC
jgi:hypothetical protein